MLSREWQSSAEVSKVVSIEPQQGMLGSVQTLEIRRDEESMKNNSGILFLRLEGRLIEIKYNLTEWDR